jgi:glycosyltransferase involved in cell wall biosynthesis
LLYLCKRSLLSDAHAFLSAANITNRVTFVDYREDVRSFYHSLDMFLLTSRYEAGWPYVIIEAMSCGLPIVTSVCYGMSDVAEAKLSHCWTFPVGSVDGCEEALKSAARAGNFEGINHRVIAQKRFSVQACFGALLDLYRLPGYGTLKSEKLTQRREALV